MPVSRAEQSISCAQVKMKVSVVVLVCVVAAASALPQFSSPSVPAPTLNNREEQFDQDGQYSRRYQLSDGTVVQETGTLVLNQAKDGLVLNKSGYFRYPTPLGQFWETEYLADETGYNVLRSNAVPVPPIAGAPTF